MNPKAKTLCEISWEVVNKVGGINTVLKTKAEVINRYYPHYYLIGPYFEQNFRLEVTPEPLPHKFLPIAYDLEKNYGIKIFYGTWEIKGKPKVILIDFQKLFSIKNEIKTNLWNWFKVDSLFSKYEFDEPVVWSYSVGLFLEGLSKTINEYIIAHFHEWLSGGGLLYLKHRKVPNIATVFTTHSTVLGRTIAGNNLDLYNVIDKINPEEYAKKFNVIDKHSMELACAQNADIFTTVSEITAQEAEILLRRKPEVLLYNGIDLLRYPTFEEISVKHTKYREEIREFLKIYFYPYYFFDLKESLTFFTSARYEYRNKGLDILIKSLGQLNRILIEKNIPKHIICFFFIPRENQGIKPSIIEAKTRYKKVKNFVTEYINEIQKNLIDEILAGNQPTIEALLPEELKENIRVLFLKFKQEGLPPLTTNVFDEENDPIIQGFKENNLLNRQEDKVKVIFYPLYLTGFDGLLDLRYYDAVLGTHLGIFPSYYEPWGYTPVETLVLGVPSITSDLAGFGQYMEDKIIGSYPGLWILRRQGKSDEEVVNDLTNLLLQYSLKKRHERVLHKMDAKALAEFSDWNRLIEKYIESHNLALRKIIEK
ncbi:MAG: glycogen/starch synthase [Candidatus Woesearchaeota archaeon]